MTREREIITHMQKFAEKLSKILGCSSTYGDILEAVRRLKTNGSMRESRLEKENKELRERLEAIWEAQKPKEPHGLQCPCIQCRWG